MDTFLLILIFLLGLVSCKRDSDISKIQEEDYKDFKGIYMLYPSYKKIYIKFQKSPKCILLEDEKINDCFYQYKKNRLLIYLNKGELEGIFVVENGFNFIRGLWKNQVRFLKKIQD